MITTAELKNHTKADLAKLAKRLGVPAPTSMRKDDLVTAVAKATKSQLATKKGGKNGSSRSAASNARNGRAKTKAGNTKSKSPAVNGSTKASGSIKAKSSKTNTEPKANGSPKTSARKKSKTKSKLPIATSAASTAKASPTAPQRAGKTKPPKPTEAVVKPKKLVAKKKTASPKPTLTNPRVLKRIRQLQLQKESNKDISFRPTLVRPPGASEPIWEKEPQKDRVSLFVRDAYWMHAAWDITRNAIDRAKAAMAEQWHGAKPVVRLLRMDDTGTTNTSETVERDIEIHGGLRNWYIDWTGEAARFRALVGYLATNGRFHAIAKSNIVRTPGAGTADAIDAHWADSGAESERIFALSGGYDGEQETGEMKEMLQDRLHRNLGAPALAKLGAGAEGPFRRRTDFHFQMEIELVVYGSTTPDGFLTLSGEPVALRPDGTFVVRLPFPDRRQVLPAVSCSRDGSQQRTIVVAVERNTKIMEPLEAECDTGE